MAFAIPKIQYKNVDTTGSTTLSDGTIVGIPDTSEIEEGMFVRGTGIPAGSTVGSVAGNNVTLADGVVATSSEIDGDYSFGFEIEFDYPPVEPNGENIETKSTINESLSGIRQVAINNIEANRSLNFSFVSQTIFEALEIFLKTHALLGNDFRYFEDKLTTDYVLYELDALKYTPKKIAPKGVDVYVWSVPLKFRRVL